MAEQTKMPYGRVTRVGPRNHVLNGVNLPPMGRGNVADVQLTKKHGKVQDFAGLGKGAECAKTTA